MSFFNATFSFSLPTVFSFTWNVAAAGLRHPPIRLAPHVATAGRVVLVVVLLVVVVVLVVVDRVLERRSRPSRTASRRPHGVRICAHQR